MSGIEGARPLARRLRALPHRPVVAAAVLVALVATLSIATALWGQEHRAGERLLPGATVAGVDVGGLTVVEATSLVAASVEDRLDAEVTARRGTEAWTTTARHLGGSVDAEAAVATAAEAASRTGWWRLAALRWIGAEAEAEAKVPDDLGLDDDTVAAWLADIAAAVDVEPTPASLVWTGQDTVVVGDATGQRLDVADGEAAVRRAIAEGAATLELSVEELPATLDRVDATRLRADVDAAVRERLDAPVTFTAGDVAHEVTAADLGARPRLAALLEHAAARAAAGHDPAGALVQRPRIPVDLDAAAVEATLAELAADVDVAPIDASVTTSGGWLAFTDAAEGLGLDRAAAASAVADAVDEGRDAVDLPVATLAPERTGEDLRDVLLVRQHERRLYHYRDGEIVADWPVAVGTGEQPTPVGTFHIGAKRHLPTWHNPAPDRWGADMPDVIGPGPTNPLGVRALNWNDGGRDTLIRFHGTSNVGSIGRASSNGCVRLSNPDVVELYDRIPQGTTVVSIRE